MKKILLTIIILFVLGYICLTFLFAANGYPGFFQDAVCFLPTSFFINHNHQLINPLYDAGLDPINHRFLFYPPLFPYTIAYIIRIIPNIDNNIQIALTIIDSLSIGLVLLSVHIYLRKNKISPKLSLYLFIILWIWALFSFYGITDGRPEILSRLFISCFLLNNIVQNKKFHNLNDGLFIGLNLITSPISTFYLILIKTGLMFYKSDFNLRSVLQTSVGFTTIIICFLFLYPYHISELIASLHKHSENVIFNRIDPNMLHKFLSIYIINPFGPLLICIFLIPLIYVYYLLVKNKKTISLALLVLLTGLISYFSFKDMFMAYNLFVLVPFYFFLIFIIFSQIYHKVLSTFIVLLLLLNTINFTRKSVLYFTTNDDKISYKEFKSDFIKVHTKIAKNEKVAIGFSLWPYCLEQYKNVTMSDNDSTTKYIIVQQLYSGKSQPQEKPGFRLILNKFINKHPKIGRVTLGNTYPWFQTAVYKKE